MTLKTKKLGVVLALTLNLIACSNTSQNTNVPIEQISTSPETASSQHAMQVETELVVSPSESPRLTLETIMANPDWIGRQPTSPGWSYSGVPVYERKREGSTIQDHYYIDNDGTSKLVALSELHLFSHQELVESIDGQFKAWRNQDSVFVQLPQRSVVQIDNSGTMSNLQFLTDNRLSVRIADTFVAIDLTTGQREQLLGWQFAKKPQANKTPADFIAQEQQSLIEYTQVQRKNREDQFNYRQELALANHAVAPSSIYFAKDHRLVAAQLSPNGSYAIVVTAKKGPRSNDTDIMPHYIQEDGRIAALKVRRRVSDAKPVQHVSWLVDITSGTKHELSYVGLPGYNDDVLASVKRENSALNGEEYVDNRLPRAIGLLTSWSRPNPSIRWHKDGSQVALMLEAWDNKDRWVVTVDFTNKKLVNHHRLHDDAWVNYRHNQFGWLNTTHTLYYLSEHSGYSHLYTQKLGEEPNALTQGDYVTNSVTLSDDDRYFYYRANKKHPGIYEIYRVNLASGEHQALTQLNGMTDYVLSPEGDQLLLTHSTLTTPPELYSLALNNQLAVTQLTHTVSKAFSEHEWALPNIVAVASSHIDKPIYARVYLPEGYNSGAAHKAVVFNHGAGYLQNAHFGWSGYFREFMFHSLLVQQGYVVLDMDYRASAGYGRDWRTAIYRQMGAPELEDIRDGVNWLVENANVDRQRIGTYGGSYGGFLTFMALFKEPDLFQAGAALRPVSDWAHYNTAYTSNILNTPDVDPIAYRESSPIYFAEGLEKPLLINAPMVDNNVFFVDVVRLVQRLIELEKENFETAIYPVEPHGFVQPSSWLDEYRRIFTLFEENL